VHVGKKIRGGKNDRKIKNTDKWGLYGIFQL
jgi:hypothetical protein